VKEAAQGPIRPRREKKIIVREKELRLRWSQIVASLYVHFARREKNGFYELQKFVV